MPTPTPEREATRLAALHSYAILDSLPEQDYDELTQLAAQICQTPVSLITLVDDKRQWFKSAHGLSIQQTEREGGFCTYTVNNPTDLSVVEDARLSDQFAHHPLVTGEPHIVFYAGAPLINEDGVALGSICVIDTQPRQLTPAQRSALGILAKQAVNLLTLHKQNNELRLIQQRYEWEQIALAQSEARFQTLIDEAPVATSLFVGRELRVEVANEPMLAIWGKGPNQIGRTLAEILPEIANQPFLAILDNVYTSGQTYSAKGGRADLVYDGVLGTYYFDFTYKPLFNSQGQVYAILQMAVDVTAEVVGRQQLMASEARFRNVIEQALTPICLLKGADMVLELGNQPLLDVLNVGTEAIGKPLLTILPEMKNQPRMGWLTDVFQQGVIHQFNEIPAYFIRSSGMREDRYFNFIYQPWREADETITGVLVMATDITDQVLARQQIHESAMALRDAHELAQLGSFSVDTNRGLITVSPLVASWFGFDSLEAEVETFIGGVGATEQEAVRASLRQSMEPGSDGRYQITHSIINAKTSQRVVIHAIGQLYRDAQGLPARVEGIAQDITAQLEQQRFLEQQVAQRTIELQTANHTLALTNEQLEQVNTLAEQANEQLRLLVHDLKRSNDNLQQFAYIASHDLQEPLRKVQSFSSLLAHQYGHVLDEAGLDLLRRMQLAGERMSTLIKDLLAYSRIATRQQVFGPVSLSAIVAEVLNTLDLTIQQTQAQVIVDELPVVNGDESQLTRLMQNLMANALKFVEPGQAPHIHITYALRDADELPSGIHPVRTSGFYHQLSVRDQGIGFEEKYLDRIFGVFQRLHGKSEFPGTGVGLAICQRVVENHGGAITASSHTGQGATFCVYLPA